VLGQFAQAIIARKISGHQFRTILEESYGLAYADYSPSTDWESAVNGERDLIMNGLGGSVVDEKRTSVEGYPGKWIRFVGQNTSGELARVRGQIWLQRAGVAFRVRGNPDACGAFLFRKNSAWLGRGFFRRSGSRILRGSRRGKWRLLS